MTLEICENIKPYIGKKLHADLSEAALKDLLIQIKGATDERGNKIAYIARDEK